MVFPLSICPCWIISARLPELYQGKSSGRIRFVIHRLSQLQAGLPEIEPAEIETKRHLSRFYPSAGYGWSQRRSFVHDAQGSTPFKRLLPGNEPLTITQETPARKGRPASFDGAVGDFILNLPAKEPFCIEWNRLADRGDQGQRGTWHRLRYPLHLLAGRCGSIWTSIIKLKPG